MSRKTLDQVDDDLGMIDEEDPSTEPELTKKTENAFFEASSNNVKLKKTMRDHSYSSNLKKIKHWK